jgi:hypothetical protein
MMATAFEALLKLNDLKNRGFTEGIEIANGNIRTYQDGTPINLTVYGWQESFIT